MSALPTPTFDALAEFNSKWSQHQYSTIELIRRLDTTQRILQNLDEQGVITPVHEGHRRIYFVEHALGAAVYVELKRLGYGVRFKQQTKTWMHGLPRRRVVERYLILTTQSLNQTSSPSQVLDLVVLQSERGEAVVVLDMARVVKRLL